MRGIFGQVCPNCFKDAQVGQTKLSSDNYHYIGSDTTSNHEQSEATASEIKESNYELGLLGTIGDDDGNKETESKEESNQEISEEIKNDTSQENAANLTKAADQVPVPGDDSADDDDDTRQVNRRGDFFKVKSNREELAKAALETSLWLATASKRDRNQWIKQLEKLRVDNEKIFTQDRVNENEQWQFCNLWALYDLKWKLKSAEVNQDVQGDPDSEWFVSLPH